MHKTIKLEDIKPTPQTSRTRNVRPLITSYRTLGLREPLMVNPASFEIISGKRRYHACREYGMRMVRVCFPSDVLEACSELGEHVTTPDSMYAIPMNPREKLELALRIGALPRPSELAHRGFSHDKYVAPTVGVSSRVLWRLRSTLAKANEGDEEPDANSIRARQILNLMLEAIDGPIKGYSPSQTIGHLHSILSHGGDIPGSLLDIELPSARNASAEKTVPHQPKILDAMKHSLPRRRTSAEFRRGVDTISGALTGLESLMYQNLPIGEDAEHMMKQLKQSQKMIRQMLRNLPGGVR
ncbi:ParB/RepB/Spo0J family partition protein [Streptomyces sp. SBC-4]|nr:ParB/RepB/Spo0J family partition protein [Streptomyces sp. SBC-4]MDV5145761.1 ParB/RepB/Spo0J family partition protein [Streptomyces sp. SBC-4]